MGAGLGLRLEGRAEVEAELEQVQVLRKNQSLIGAAGQVTLPVPRHPAGDALATPTRPTGALTWLGWIDARCADHLREGRANRDLDGALLGGGELMRGGLLVVLWSWLVMLWRRAKWSLLHGRRLNVRTGWDRTTSEMPSQQ